MEDDTENWEIKDLSGVLEIDPNLNSLLRPIGQGSNPVDLIVWEMKEKHDLINHFIQSRYNIRANSIILIRMIKNSPSMSSYQDITNYSSRTTCPVFLNILAN